MKEFINPFTKTSFFVADDRVEEYKAAGYPLAASSEEAKTEVEEPKTEVIEAEPEEITEEVIEAEPEEITEEAIEEEKPTKVEEVKETKKGSKKGKK